MNLPEFDLAEYVKDLCDDCGVLMNFHDIAGVSEIDSDIYDAFSPCLYHNNPFCNAVKKTAAGIYACQLNKKSVLKRCDISEGAFYGRCYAGIEEITFPIRWNGRLIAFLCFGQFYTDLNNSLLNMRKGLSKLELNPDDFENQYLDTIKPHNIDLRELSLRAGLLVEYLSSRYGLFLLTAAKGSTIKRTAELHKSGFIIDNALRTIHENYLFPLSLKTIATSCYCSEPYLSRIFKEHVGTTLTAYLNNFRVAKAKEKLDITSLPIAEIAHLCGFSDSNYFTRVFHEQTGISPSAYRARKS